MEYIIEVAVHVSSSQELSEDAVNVIDDLKEELIDAIENVLDLEDAEPMPMQPGQVIEAEAVYTVPLHSGRIVRVPEGSFVEYYSAGEQSTGVSSGSANGV
jgi:hypothetical protein